MHTLTIGGGARALLACAAGGLLAAGCGPGGGADPAAESAEPTPHGYVEGAEEAAEPQWRLVMADTADGALHILDPATEKTTEIGAAPGVREVATDGRFAYFGTGDTAAVLDSGVWTVDHGDHKHYYRTRPDLVGEARAGGALRASGDPAVTALSSADGVRVLDRPGLEEGTVDQTAVPGGGSAVAYGERLIVARPGGTVDVLDRGGDPAEPTVAQRCPEPGGKAVTRRGAVLLCSDGALLLTGTGADLEAAEIPYPGDGDRARPTSLHHRPGSDIVAGPAGDEGVWLLDTDAAEWTFIETGPALSVSAAGEGMPVLVLGEDGTLRAYDPASGERTAETELMEPPEDTGTAAPSVHIDTSRAYVNDPAADAVYEIDYNDDLRLARTFDLGFSPDLMVETG